MDSRQNFNPHFTTNNTMDYAAAFNSELSSSRSSSESTPILQQDQNLNSSKTSITPTSTPTGAVQTSEQHLSRDNDNLTPGSHDHSRNSSTSRRQESADNNQSYTPSRKNAIVLENTSAFTQDQVLRAVADCVGGSNIHYCTRLSNGRICLYLTNEECVNQITDDGGIIIGGIYVSCRRYVSEAKKIVISNCPPELTDNDLKKILEPYGRIVSAPNRLRVTTAHSDLKHIKSWRRSIFMMLPNEAQPLPPRLIITSSDGLRNTLYIEKDEILCTYCHAPGHTEQRCKKKQAMEKEFPSLTTSYHGPASHRLFVHSTAKQSQPAREQFQENPPQQITNNFMPSFSSRPTIEISQTTIIPNPTPRVEETRIESSFDFSALPRNEEPKEQPSTTIPREEANISGEISSLEDSFGLTNTDNQNHSTQNPYYSFDDPLSESLPSTSKKRFLSPNEEINDQHKFAKTIVSDYQSGSEASNSETQDEPQTMEDNEMSDSSAEFLPKSKKALKKHKKQEQAFNIATEKIVFDDTKLSFYQFQEFLKNARGKANSKQVAARITPLTSELIKKLEEAIVFSTDHNLTRRMQRAAEALKEPNV